VQAYFWRKFIFLERPNFGAYAIAEKKEACRKRRKSNMQEKKQRGTQVGKPNHDRVRVFYKDCNECTPKK
jgi:hypothetical protein